MDPAIELAHAIHRITYNAESELYYQLIDKRMTWLHIARELDKDDEPDSPEVPREDVAMNKIQSEAKSILVRGDWHPPGKPSDTAEYRLKVEIEGQAIRITGHIDHGEIVDAQFVNERWNWIPIYNDKNREAMLLEYVRLFPIKEDWHE